MMHEHPREPVIECRRIIDDVFAYIDGQLAEADRAHFAAHVAVCARCATYLHHGERLLQCIGTRAKVQSAPPWLRRRVLDALIALEEGATDE
jgi:mycothiol system anti-sigma-R factor